MPRSSVADISHFVDDVSSQFHGAAPNVSALPTVKNVPLSAWRSLAARAMEPNAYQTPDWAKAVASSARGGAGAQTLTAWRSAGSAARLIGAIPVLSLWRAYRLPLPGLVNVDPHTSLGTPLIDSDESVTAISALLHEARETGAHALLLRNATINGPMMHALNAALAQDGFKPIVSATYERAFLDATRDGDELLHDALGSKKLKQLRRQRNRLAEYGDVTFEVARTPSEVAAALPIFLNLEASGWKGERGTALGQHEGNLAFIRKATSDLADQGQCEIITLRAGETPVAAGIVLRHLNRAYYFKIGVDPAFAKYSVGVQLTLDLTRHLCADPAINSADSTASPGHPMIDPIWRGRLAIGDILIPLRRYDPVFPVIRFALFARRHARLFALRMLGR